jgi:hypothetical protein
VRSTATSAVSRTCTSTTRAGPCATSSSTPATGCRAGRCWSRRATDGELGHVEDFLADEQSWAIRYLIVDPRSWWPGDHVLVGTEWITGVSWDDSTVVLDVDRESVRSAPRWDPGQAPDRAYETRLHGHYRRRGYWDRRPESWTLRPPAA